jgi:hypothetical protein
LIAHVLNLFYEEPASDRWIRYDRYPRRLVRRLLRGKPRPGGQTRMFLNLCAGLDRIGVSYRVNDYRYAVRHPEEVACIIGKAFVLNKVEWKNPILFGTAIYSHPLDDPHLFERHPVKKVLVPGPWMKAMCEPIWGEALEAWPVGIDTEQWRPTDLARKMIDCLIYDKVMWNHTRYESTLIEPIRRTLRGLGRSFREIRYGYYREEDYHRALSECRAMVFLCEHETQGIAYQQALSCDVPILAWDRGGYWQDPAYYPHKVRFEPVTSVPYWDERCGMKFSDLEEFSVEWGCFWSGVRHQSFSPRAYILENLTLEKCAVDYVANSEHVARLAS